MQKLLVSLGNYSSCSYHINNSCGDCGTSHLNETAVCSYWIMKYAGSNKRRKWILEKGRRPTSPEARTRSYGLASGIAVHTSELSDTNCLLNVFSNTYKRGLAASILDGLTQCIIDAFPRTFESKLSYHLPYQVVVGP